MDEVCSDKKFVTVGANTDVDELGEMMIQHKAVFKAGQPMPMPAGARRYKHVRHG